MKPACRGPRKKRQSGLPPAYVLPIFYSKKDFLFSMVNGNSLIPYPFIDRVLISRDEIDQRVARLGEQITTIIKDWTTVVAGVYCVAASCS